MWFILLLLGGAALVASGERVPTLIRFNIVPTNDWSNVVRMNRVSYPPKPFYAPNVKSVHYPFCWFGISGENRPVAYNRAIDITGTPWDAMMIGGYGYSPGTYPSNNFCRGVGGNDGLSYTGGEVWDVDTWSWVPCTDGTYQWVAGHFKDENDFFDDATDYVNTKLIPQLAVIAGAYIGGIGGAVAAAAIEASWNIIRGKKIVPTLIDAYKDHLQGEMEKTAYGQAYKNVVATYHQTQEQIEAIRSDIVHTYGYADPELVGKAVDAGIGVARAQQVQDAIITAVKTRGAPEAAAWLDECLKRGVYLQDWVVAMYGTDGADLMKWAASTASDALDRGVDPNAAVKPAINKKLVDAIGKALAS